MSRFASPDEVVREARRLGPRRVRAEVQRQAQEMLQLVRQITREVKALKQRKAELERENAKLCKMVLVAGGRIAKLEDEKFRFRAARP